MTSSRPDTAQDSILALLRADLAGCRRNPLRLFTVRSIAVVLFRLSSAAGAVLPPAGFLIKQLNHVVTGADIAWQAHIGRGLQLFHPTGVVIGPFVTMGAHCRVQQGVTLGGLGADDGSPLDSPTLGNRVHLGAGCRVIGSVTVGDQAQIGSNAVVTRDVPTGATAVGVPARLLDKSTAQ